MPSAVTWTDLEIIVLSEASQTEKDKYILYLKGGIKKKMIQMNLYIKHK